MKVRGLRRGPSDEGEGTKERPMLRPKKIEETKERPMQEGQVGYFFCPCRITSSNPRRSPQGTKATLAQPA